VRLDNKNAASSR